jgi:hypothetical protein
MLHEFLTANRDALIESCREKAARRFAPSKAPATVNHGVPFFLRQVVDTLCFEQSTRTRGSDEPEPTPANTEIGRAAALHGTELRRLGYSVDQVVHDYGDVCQAVTELAVKEKATISADEFRTLNRCLDNAIADAVTSFGGEREILINAQAATLHERLNFFANEQRRLIDIATESFSAIRIGKVGVTGATATLLIHALEDLGHLANHALPEIRLASAQSTVALP